MSETIGRDSVINTEPARLRVPARVRLGPLVNSRCWKTFAKFRSLNRGFIGGAEFINQKRLYHARRRFLRSIVQNHQR